MTRDNRTAAEIEEAGRALRMKLLKASKGQSVDWMHDFDETDLRVIVAAMVNLGFAAHDDTAPEAARDTARSMLEMKLTERMIAKMETLILRPLADLRPCADPAPLAAAEGGCRSAMSRTSSATPT